jgi:hypothetical protein
MRKILVSAIVLVLLLSLGGYYLCRVYFTDLIAGAFVSESLPGYVPKRIQSRIKAISIPLNKGTEAMLRKMHSADIPMEDILTILDNTSEEEAYSLLDELNSTRPKTPDEVFDIVKRYIHADFDVEVFRKPFKDHVDMKQVRKALYYANENRKTHDVDFLTAKAILKKILLQKEHEYQTGAK